MQARTVRPCRGYGNADVYKRQGFVVTNYLIFCQQKLLNYNKSILRCTMSVSYTHLLRLGRAGIRERLAHPLFQGDDQGTVGSEPQPHGDHLFLRVQRTLFREGGGRKNSVTGADA